MEVVINSLCIAHYFDPVKEISSTKPGPSMGIESGSLTCTLKPMEVNGLIKRVPDDKRMI